MQPYQERVVAEKNELDERLAKLDRYLRSPANYCQVISHDWELLILQRGYMENYSRVLGQRIEAF